MTFFILVLNTKKTNFFIRATYAFKNHNPLWFLRKLRIAICKLRIADNFAHPVMAPAHLHATTVAVHLALFPKAQVESQKQFLMKQITS